MREYLTFLGLKYSLSVLDAEVSSASAGHKAFPGRAQLVRAMGLSSTMEAATGGEAASPLLAEVLRLSKVTVLKSETPTLTERSVLEFYLFFLSVPF